MLFLLNQQLYRRIVQGGQRQLNLLTAAFFRHVNRLLIRFNRDRRHVKLRIQQVQHRREIPGGHINHFILLLLIPAARKQPQTVARTGRQPQTDPEGRQLGFLRC